mmetsp:Transcript_28850/g.31013  ORF Transcript_28850/g.31013 Transcript_28850/m.31013 type:complete len:115 (-) Transcript_28850:52-396(-)
MNKAEGIVAVEKGRSDPFHLMCKRNNGIGHRRKNCTNDRKASITVLYNTEGAFNHTSTFVGGPIPFPFAHNMKLCRQFIRHPKTKTKNEQERDDKSCLYLFSFATHNVVALRHK